MKMVLSAITVLSCNSFVVDNLTSNTTVVYVCPNTVLMRFEERLETPMDVARMKHYWSLPRDDRPPLPVVEDKPKAETKKAVKKKTKRKKKRRRG